MALPSRNAALSLNYAWRGQPFCRIEAKPAGSGSMDFTWRGQPFVVLNVGADQRALRLRANGSGYAQVTDAEVGTGLKPIVHLSGALKQRATTEGDPLVLIAGQIRVIDPNDTLLV